MARLRNLIRALLVTLLLIAVVVPVGIYIVMSTPWAQDKLKDVACDQLTTLLGTPVEIGRIDYRPFHFLAITSVTVRDASAAPALSIGRVAARFELWHFVRTGRMVFDYAVIDAPEVHINRPSPGAPLNIQPIIDRLKPKDKNKPPTEFDLKIGTLILRSGRLTYDVLSLPDSTGTFNPNHISLSGLNLHAYLRHATRDNYDYAIESLSFKEKSGMTLSDLYIDGTVTPADISLNKFSLKLPHSELSIAPVKLAIDGLNDIPSALRREQLNLSTLRPMKLSTDDFGWISPDIAQLDRTVNASFNITASLRHVDITSLDISDSQKLRLEAKGHIERPDSIEIAKASIEILRAEAPASELGDIVGRFNPEAAKYVRRAGNIALRGHAEADIRHADIDIRGSVGSGKLAVDMAAGSPDRFRSVKFDGTVDITDLPVGTILDKPALGQLTASVQAAGIVSNRNVAAEGAVKIDRLDWQGHTYSEIYLEGTHDETGTQLKASSADPAAKFSLDALGHLTDPQKDIEIDLDLANFSPTALNIKCPRPGITVAGRLKAYLQGTSVDDVDGKIEINDLSLNDPDGDDLSITNLTLEADRSTNPEYISLTGDFINGSIQGTINPSVLIPTVRDMAAHIVPDLLEHDENLHEELSEKSLHNNFHLELSIENAEQISRFFHLPVQIIYPVEITANLNSVQGTASFTLDAPYLQQGDKIIDSTVVGGYISTANNRATVYATTHMPTKKGPMAVVLGVSGSESRFDTKIDWQIERKIPLNGLIDFSTALSRSEAGTVCANTSFNPGQINFGDDVWNIHPSTIDWCDNRLTFDNFRLTAGQQSIAIDGTASPQPEDTVTVNLNKITLASIFETLEIDKALIGGTATGTFTASQALSKIPMLAIDNLHVDNIAYNYCTIGNADVSANWNNERQAFFLDADITNPQGQHSRIWGDIVPAGESLDLNFDAKHVKVGFMQPFMDAFAKDISGYVSGKARLFGTFKNIDMEGDVLADSLRLKIDFTNTYYTATDSIHIKPGLIKLSDITLYDVDGHTAKLNGQLTHDFFHNPLFDFRITDARNFLSYNVTPKINPDWYGTIYGNGGATIVGKPGVIEIGVNMSTAPNSTFTFVLSDRLEAEQYSFITFNDKTVYSEEEMLLSTDDTPAVVKEFQARMKARIDEAPSNYVMDIRADITPDAQIILVMDPVGGDRIRANGTGDLRMTYDAFENDIRMYGTYTLDRGSYNFTLQDIIIKDFTINPGSSITFRGDPYSAQLDLEAVYQVNANLSDLDESFTQDKDLNRTNVPVQALMKVTGDMRQPDLAFDLAFPTLTSDTYRKVRSIISTDDMMNRQIIYLLALNRFYTPDYMASTTKGNELFSVASSTISSQLSSMLGKLSENWSIAPNLRSDRGDFSDVEVDVALSSRLLNNRLLFNGNFGYRDKSLNTNQFIGDFDIEYLLTPKGTWRLKAYNRYNDQNYYVRTATTTQGVGIMFRRDFDSLTSWLKPKKKKTAPTDSSRTTIPADTVKAPAGK